MLGINGLGAALAMGADANRNTISAGNCVGLLRRNRLPAKCESIDWTRTNMDDLNTVISERKRRDTAVAAPQNLTVRDPVARSRISGPDEDQRRSVL